MAQISSPQAPADAPTAWVRLLKAHAAVKRRFNAALVEQHGLSVTDYDVMLALAHAEGGRMKRVDLAELIELTPSGITRLLERLERAGWVEKSSCETDARISYAKLTELGLVKLEQAGEAHSEVIAAVFGERFDGPELEQLNALLARLPGGGDADPDSCTA